MSEFSEQHEKWLKLQQKVQEKLIVDTVEFFDEFEIETLLIKGRATAEFYPAKHHRISTDIDLSVEPKKYAKALELLHTFSTSANVDLHNGIRYLETVDWSDLYENRKCITLGSKEVNILCPEDHLRLTCVHWLNDGAEYRERLWDIYWLVENRPENFDWNRCLNIVAPHRRQWVVFAIGAAHKYLDLKIDDLPFAAEAKKLPAWFIKTIEKEWARDTRLSPMRLTSISPRTFFQQFRKRFPPNPITATIMVDGSLDAKTRFFYQLENFYLRFRSSFYKFVTKKHLRG